MKSDSVARAAGWSWNVVLIGCPDGETAVELVQQELSGLEEALHEMTAKTVHLHVTITRSDAAGDYFVQATLKLPDRIVHADESAMEVAHGVRMALGRLRDELRSAFGDTPAAPEDDEAGVAGFGAPLGAGEGPQSRRELVQRLFADNYPRLLRYARRRLRFYEQSGILDRGEVDPRELVDEAALRCLEEPIDALPRLDYLVWFHELVREELQRCCGEHRLQERWRGAFPKSRLDESGGEDLASSVAAALEADETFDEERVPDAAARSPEEAAEESDLVALVLDNAGSWPAFDREVLALHFVEGFAPAEIARIEKTDTAQVEKALAGVTQRLRSMLRDEPYLR